MASLRPDIKGSRHAVSTGHYLATTAAFQILEAGGNAIDAGVCAGLCLGVLQSDLVNVAGVAPIILYDAMTEQVATVSGLGWWPKRADPAYFRESHDGRIPKGLMRTVVPAAPDAWITALERWGTMSFGEVAMAAIRLARDGFPMYPLLRQTIVDNVDDYRRFPSTAAIYLPDGEPPMLNKLFVQTDLAASLQYMADQERARRGDRAAGLAAARLAFYRGDIARKIVDFHASEGGWMTMEDMADFRVAIEPAVSTSFGDTTVYACGPWCQGPALLQALNLLEGADVGRLRYNSAEYIHLLAEATKLVMADRERWYGDPRFVDVPLDRLLSRDYAAERLALFDPHRAWPAMPPAGLDRATAPPAGTNVDASLDREDGAALDTSYLCVVDHAGNVFSATPSDASYHTPIVPGTGLAPSGRGNQSWTVTGHPSVLAPGKRPRLTPNPALAIQDGRRFIPFGTPGGDVQTQAMMQTLLNVLVYGMEPQEAVEQPRFASYSFPSSFEPHQDHPGLLRLESRIAQETGSALSELGHTIEWWPDWTWLAGAVCMIVDDRQTGIKSGAADPRRAGYALSW